MFSVKNFKLKCNNFTKEERLFKTFKFVKKYNESKKKTHSSYESRG